MCVEFTVFEPQSIVFERVEFRANPAALTDSSFKMVFRCNTLDSNSDTFDCKFLGGPYIIDPDNRIECESNFLQLIANAIEDFVFYYPGLTIQNVMLEAYYTHPV